MWGVQLLALFLALVLPAPPRDFMLLQHHVTSSSFVADIMLICCMTAPRHLGPLLRQHATLCSFTRRCIFFPSPLLVTDFLCIALGSSTCGSPAPRALRRARPSCTTSPRRRPPHRSCSSRCLCPRLPSPRPRPPSTSSVTSSTSSTTVLCGACDPCFSARPRGGRKWLGRPGPARRFRAHSQIGSRHQRRRRGAATSCV